MVGACPATTPYDYIAAGHFRGGKMALKRDVDSGALHIYVRSTLDMLTRGVVRHGWVQHDLSGRPKRSGEFLTCTLAECHVKICVLQRN